MLPHVGLYSPCGLAHRCLHHSQAAHEQPRSNHELLHDAVHCRQDKIAQHHASIKRPQEYDRMQEGGAFQCQCTMATTLGHIESHQVALPGRLSIAFQDGQSDKWGGAFMLSVLAFWCSGQTKQGPCCHPNSSPSGPQYIQDYCMQIAACITSQDMRYMYYGSRHATYCALSM